MHACTCTCVLSTLFRTHPIGIHVHTHVRTHCTYTCTSNSLYLIPYHSPLNSLPFPTHVCTICMHMQLYMYICAHTHTHTHTVFIGGNPKDDKQTTFLAWQTWDLLRLTIEGFIGLCSDFLVRNPG